MKKLFTSLITLLICVAVFAQSPESMKYQSVVRDNSGAIIANQSVGLQLSILQTSSTGTSVYVETHSVTTNSFGLINIDIGGGTVQSGTFSTIDWGSDTYFLKVEMDVTGGTSYATFGTSKFLSVPYALHAKNVDSVDDADADPTNEIQTLSKTGNSITLSNGGGTVTDAITDADADVTNELQTLSLSNDTLSISSGNSVKLPSGGSGDNWGTQVAQTNLTLMGDGTAGLPLSLAPQGATVAQVLSWSGTSWMPANEAQILSLAGSNLSISGGNSVLLPPSPWGINSSDVFYNTGNVGIGFNSPQTYLHIQDANGMAAPQIQIDNTFATAQGNASIGFSNTNATVNYSFGMDNTTAKFKISAASQLQPSLQNDGVTLYSAVLHGITSFNNQSRARVFQAQGAISQLIPFATWQPIDFDMLTYDTHAEWQLAGVGSSGIGGGPATSFFIVMEDGYYQVNARTDFMFLEDYDPMALNMNGHVSIAIWVGSAGLLPVAYSKGNKLQGSVFFMNPQIGEVIFALPNNMAPNVSDVIYLRSGDTVEIRVWQDVFQNLGLIQGTAETYVSIHKIS